jgi:hypothetical protein
MPALAFDFLCSVFKEHHFGRTQSSRRLEVQVPLYPQVAAIWAANQRMFAPRTTWAVWGGF